MINPEDKVNIRAFKDQMKEVNVSQFKGDVLVIIRYIESVYDAILSEDASHQDFFEYVLKALDSVQHDQFR